MTRATASPAIPTGTRRVAPSRPTTARTARGWLLRRAGAAVLALGTVLAALLLTGAPAAAANAPTLITITGTNVGIPVMVHSDTQADLFNELLKQLSWMQGATGTPMQVKQETLGTKYTATISAGGDAVQVYDLYPEAVGGPRAFRPAAQPTGKSSDGWFYASVSLPDVLHAAGVSIANSDTQIGLQQAGLEGVDIGTTTQATSLRVNLRGELAQLKTAMLSSVATSFGALVLLFGAARFSRYRYRRRASN